MRIVPINNNNFSYKGKMPSISRTGKFKAGIAAALIATVGVNYCKNKELWDEFIKDERQERIDNLRVEPVIEDFDTQEAAINYAFDRTLDWLNQDEPKEYSVCIDNKTHNILTEFRGQETSVTSRKTFKMIAKQKICKDFSYTSIHGHPGQSNGGTTTFSVTDLKTFLTSDFCTEEYVLNRERKFCRMKKEENYRKPTKEELDRILEDYERVCSIAQAWQKVIKDENGNIIYEFIDYPILHDALDRYLKPFGISYTTTFGVYDGLNDIYKDGYYEGFKDGKLLSSVVAKQID